MKYMLRDLIKCPVCGEIQDGQVEDFVIPGFVGAKSSAVDQCWNCDAEFVVTYLDGVEFKVEPL